MVVVVGALAVWRYNAVPAPINDPSYFCQTPDPTAASFIAATTILQGCAAGKTFQLERGQTVAVDLDGGHGFDTSIQWTDLVVSDGHVLSTQLAPGQTSLPGTRVDEVAVYRAARTGQSAISAVLHECLAANPNFDPCKRGHVWSVTIHVV